MVSLKSTIRNRIIFFVICAVFFFSGLRSFSKSGSPLADTEQSSMISNLGNSMQTVEHYNSSFPLSLWSSDFHISPIADIKNILIDFRVSIIDKSLSGHCHLSNTCETDLKVLTKQNGIRLSPCHNQIIRDFYKAYRTDTQFMSTNGILCNHATSMCELFMPFNKPLIVIASTR